MDSKTRNYCHFVLGTNLIDEVLIQLGTYWRVIYFLLLQGQTSYILFLHTYDHWYAPMYFIYLEEDILVEIFRIFFTILLRH